MENVYQKMSVETQNQSIFHHKFPVYSNISLVVQAVDVTIQVATQEMAAVQKDVHQMKVESIVLIRKCDNFAYRRNLEVHS